MRPRSCAARGRPETDSPPGPGPAPPGRDSRAHPSAAARRRERVRPGRSRGAGTGQRPAPPADSAPEDRPMRIPFRSGTLGSDGPGRAAVRQGVSTAGRNQTPSANAGSWQSQRNGLPTLVPCADGRIPGRGAVPGAPWTRRGQGRKARPTTTGGTAHPWLQDSETAFHPATPTQHALSSEDNPRPRGAWIAPQPAPHSPVTVAHAVRKRFLRTPCTPTRGRYSSSTR